VTIAVTGAAVVLPVTPLAVPEPVATPAGTPRAGDGLFAVPNAGALSAVALVTSSVVIDGVHADPVAVAVEAGAS